MSLGEWLNSMRVDVLWHWLPLAITLLVLFVAHLGLRRWGVHQHRVGQFSRFREQWLNFLLGLLTVLAVIIAAPIDNQLRGQLLSLFGIVVSATIALSSTTLMGNLLAGLMLRSVSNLQAGNFIRVGEQFGRITQRGLLHVEIQTEDSDLTTLPNLLLVQQPFTVMRTSGTFISGEVSLGYDVNHRIVERVLLSAAENAGLEDSFVQVRELADFSVLYRVAGKLTEVKQLVSARARLRASMLDALHSANIEIVSPTFMNQRRIETEQKFIPPAVKQRPEEPEKEIEEVLFDKAERALMAERLEKRLSAIRAKIEEAEEKSKGLSDDEEAKALDARLENWRRREKQVEFLLEEARNETENGD